MTTAERQAAAYRADADAHRRLADKLDHMADQIEKDTGHSRPTDEKAAK